MFPDTSYTTSPQKQLPFTAHSDMILSQLI
jgi:hypothetical protein